MPPSGPELAEQLDWHWNAQLRPRLSGVTDAEYFWEPAPNSWSVRDDGRGGWAPDWDPAPDPPPFTTIGWRMCHLLVVFAFRADYHFGTRTLTIESVPWPGGADAALEAIDRAYAEW